MYSICKFCNITIICNSNYFTAVLEFKSLIFTQKFSSLHRLNLFEIHMTILTKLEKRHLLIFANKICQWKNKNWFILEWKDEKFTLFSKNVAFTKSFAKKCEVLRNIYTVNKKSNCLSNSNCPVDRKQFD